jgi:putative flippase GtrA
MKIFKYFFVGGVAAVVDISLFIVFAKILTYNYLLVGALTFLIATFVNYILSIKFVFQSGQKHKKQKEILLVYLVSAFGLAFNLIILYVCHDIINIELTISKLIATALVFFWNYFIRKYFIF